MILHKPVEVAEVEALMHKLNGALQVLRIERPRLGGQRLRLAPFSGELQLQKSLAPGGSNRSQCRPHGEFFLPENNEALHGRNAKGSGRG